jgi:group I intron endonuclease
MSSGIYMIRNKLNEKKYIGQGENVEKRMMEKHYRCNAIFSALKFYGSENFEYKIIFLCPIEELDIWEKYYIKELHTHISEGGYNISWGGDANMRGRKQSASAKEKCRKSKLGEKNPMFGAHHSEEHRRKQSIALLGKPKTLDSRKKLSETKSRGNCYNFGTKRCNSTSKYFGVSLSNRKTNRWLVGFSEDGIMRFVGRFKTELDAAKAYDKHVVENGLIHPLNFPEDYTGRATTESSKEFCNK